MIMDSTESTITDVAPQNRPWSVVDYCVEEVERQGHDTTRLDGLRRVGWMLDAWSLALYELGFSSPREDSRHGSGPARLSVGLVERLGELVEPEKNKNGFRECGVRVGGAVCPEWRKVRGLVKELVYEQDAMDPLTFYRAFLEIHPFVDGNGRTAKILLNWKNGTLLENPLFPPNDFWGRWIRNP